MRWPSATALAASLITAFRVDSLPLQSLSTVTMVVITRLALSTLTVATMVASTTLFGQQPQRGPKSGCDNQARSLAERKRSLEGARMPSAADLSGTWVAIGIFGA